MTRFSFLTFCICLLIGLLITGNTHAQTPSFSMTVSNENVNGACVGIGVLFTNTSSVSQSKLKWDFGDNYSTASVNSISHAYIQGGTYTITLTNTETQAKTTRTLTVYNNPTADFSLSDSIVCAGANITFTSTSTPSNSTIKTYTWSFGDGNVLSQSTSSTTSYAYNTAGTYVPILTVRDNNGCAGTSPTNKHIKINGSQLQSSFLANGTVFFSCTNSINLENTTDESGKSGITYLWNFGDNETSAQKSPTNHTYATPGVYTISLQAGFAGIVGCTPIYSKKVYIGKPDITIVAPQSICQNQNLALEANTSIAGFATSTNDLLWSVNNGASINNDTTTASFPNSGATTLSATNKNGCKSTTATQINILPSPSFSVNLTPNSGACIGTNIDATINVSNGLSINKYVWLPQGVDGSVHDTTTTNNYSYTYTNAGQYAYSVSAIASNGCSTVKSQPIAISEECIDNGFGSAYNPIFSFESVSCASKYTIILRNKQSNPVNYWLIGGVQYPAINGQYSNPIALSPATRGTIYQVSTYYTTGNPDLNRKITIIDENANFDIINSDNTSLYCANNRVSFKTDNYVNAANITSFTWKITDANNNTVYSSGSSNIEYSFLKAGTYSVALTIADVHTPSCVSTSIKPLQINGFGGDFSANAFSFCNPNPNVTFQSNIVLGSAKLRNITWSFGDGTTSSINYPNVNNSVNHQYSSNNASYNAFGVTMNASDTMGCTINISKANYIQTYQPKIGLKSNDTLLCSSRNVVISNLSDASNATYTWTVGNTTQTTYGSQSFNYTFSNAANPSDVNLKLHLVDGGGCTKDTTINSYIRFRTPVAKYTISNQAELYNCPPFTLTIKNTSQNYDSIHWNINDDFSSIQKDSFYYTVLHPGPVSITLESLLDGCKDSYNENYTVKGPVAKLLTKDTIGCTPYTTFLYLSNNSDIVSYQWDKGDGITYVTDKTSDSMRFTYAKGGTYYPSVTFIGKEGCSDKQEYPSPIIALQSVDLKYQNQYVFCSNDTLLNISVSSDNAIKYSWTQNPTTGYMTDTVGTTIGVRPTENTVYHVFAKSENTCPDDSADIAAQRVIASEVTINPNTITEPAGTVFRFSPIITNEDLGVKYFWTPDYRIDNRYAKSPTIVADKDTTYYLNIKNENGCVSSDSVHVKVLCNTSKLLMANAFTPNGDGKNDVFYVTGYGIKNVVHFIIVDRWGKKVFERNNISSNDISQGWDGKINGKQATPGSYIYMAEVECTEGNIIPLKGSVVLIR